MSGPGPGAGVVSGGALAGIRILDLSWGVAGPLGVMMLAELGADVVKVEPPAGDPFRAHPGYPVWNRSRRSLAVDLRRAEGRAVLLRLCASADVLVEAFSPGTMAKLQLSYDELHATFPRLVYCSVPAYPASHRFASRPGWDALVQARSGMQHEQPGWRPGPTALHMPAPSMATFFLVAAGVLAALVAREETGRGQHVETSLYQGVLAYTTQIWQQVENGPPGFRAVMGKTFPPGIHQGSLYECAGGRWVHAATMSGIAPTRSLDDVLGLDDVDIGRLLSDPEYRGAHEERRRQAFRARDRDELVAELHAAGLGAEAVEPMSAAFAHPQLRANDMVVDVDDPELGPTTQIGVPVALVATPGAVRGCQPRVGQHSREVLTEAGYDGADVERLIASGVVSEPDQAGARG